MYGAYRFILVPSIFDDGSAVLLGLLHHGPIRDLWHGIETPAS